MCGHEVRWLILCVCYRNIINKMHYRQLVMREKDLQQDPENDAQLQEFEKCMNTMMTAQPQKADVSSFFKGILLTLVVVMVSGIDDLIKEA